MGIGSKSAECKLDHVGLAGNDGPSFVHLSGSFFGEPAKVSR